MKALLILVVGLSAALAADHAKSPKKPDHKGSKRSVFGEAQYGLPNAYTFGTAYNGGASLVNVAAPTITTYGTGTSGINTYGVSTGTSGINTYGVSTGTSAINTYGVTSPSAVHLNYAANYGLDTSSAYPNNFISGPPVVAVQQPHVEHVVHTKTVQVPVPQPYAVPVEKHVPIPVAVDRPVPVAVEKSVPYPVDRPVPYPVDRPYPVHIEKKVSVPVPVDRPYPVTVEKQVPVAVDRPVPVQVPVPQPYPVHVEKKVPYAVDRPVVVTVERQVPVAVPYKVEVPVDKPYPVHIEKKIPYPVYINKPYAVPVEKQVAVPYKVPVPYHVDRPVPVAVEKKVPVIVEKPVPYTVEKKVPYAVHVDRPVPVPVEKHIPIPVDRPYPVHVDREVQVPVPVAVQPQVIQGYSLSQRPSVLVAHQPAIRVVPAGVVVSPFSSISSSTGSALGTNVIFDGTRTVSVPTSSISIKDGSAGLLTGTISGGLTGAISGVSVDSDFVRKVADIQSNAGLLTSSSFDISRGLADTQILPGAVATVSQDSANFPSLLPSVQDFKSSQVVSKLPTSGIISEKFDVSDTSSKVYQNSASQITVLRDANSKKIVKEKKHV